MGRRFVNCELTSAPIVPLDRSPDSNVLINHRRPATLEIAIVAVEPFKLDQRLF